MFFAVASMQRALAAILATALAIPAFGASTVDPDNPKKWQKYPAGSRLEGQVLGPAGKPVKGATITVRSLEGDKSWTSAPTNSRGAFYLPGISYGWNDLIVSTEKGDFLGDQPINLPPGTRVVVKFNLLETADKPTSWWTDRRVEPPAGITVSEVAGMAQSSQKLTGVEYWKSPAGIAILVSVGVVALAVIASGAGSSTSP
jgi:hypothetical protein